MDAEKFARKLEPLMREQVEHWRRVRDFVDSETKQLVDRQIAETANRVLDNFRKKLLLALPSKGIAKGTFNLGTVIYEKEKWPTGISKSELLQNLAIFGRSGAGKTNVTFHLLAQLVEKKIPFLFLDWKRTARHLIPLIKKSINVYTPGRQVSPFTFNPFVVPPGLESNVYTNHVVDVMADAYTLGEGATRLLQKAISACYRRENHAPTVDAALREIENYDAKGRSANWKVSALRALESISFANITGRNSVSQQELVNAFLHSNTIIELDALDQSSKQFLIPLLCFWIYSVRLASGNREKLSLVIFIEEAHHVLYRQEQRSKETLMNQLLRQCREIGIGIVVVDQHPHLMSSAALGNTYTSICLNQKNPSDINKAAALSLVSDEDKRHLSMLPVGQGVVKLQDRWRRPFLVQFPLVDVQKGSVSDDVLARYLQRSSTGSARKRFWNQEFGQVRQVRDLDSTLDEESLRFIEDVLRHQDDGVKVRYIRLGLSADKGNRLKETLVERGWLEAQEIGLGRTRKVLLRPTTNAKQMLGIEDNRGVFRESIAHEYWKRYYARLFAEQGYQVELEALRRGGRVDVLARKGAERVGIEVETGKSNVVENVKNGLLSRFDRVLVVATDEVAMGKVERQIGEAGLLILNKVDLIRRERFPHLRTF